MPITVPCPECKTSYRVNDEMAGKRGKCPQGHLLLIPAQADGAERPAPTSSQPTLRPQADNVKTQAPIAAGLGRPLPPPQEGYARVRLTTDGIVLHAANDLNSPVLTRLAAGDFLNLRRGPLAWTTWYQAILPDGRSGWFSADFNFQFIVKSALVKDCLAYSSPSTDSNATAVSKHDEPFYICDVVEQNESTWVQIRSDSGKGGYVLFEQVQTLERPSIPGGATLAFAVGTAVITGLGGGAITGALAAVGNGTLGWAGILIWLLTVVGVKGLIPRVLASVSFAVAAAVVIGLLQLIL